MGAIYYKICIDSYEIYLLECFTSPLSRVIYDLIAVFYYTNRAKELSRDDLVTT